MHFIDIQQNVIFVFCIWAKIWEFGHNSKFIFIFPSLGAYIFSLEYNRTIGNIQIDFSTLAVFPAAGPFLFMIDISLAFGEVLKQAVGVSDLWL